MVIAVDLLNIFLFGCMAIIGYLVVKSIFND